MEREIRLPLRRRLPQRPRFGHDDRDLRNCLAPRHPNRHHGRSHQQPPPSLGSFRSDFDSFIGIVPRAPSLYFDMQYAPSLFRRHCVLIGSLFRYTPSSLCVVKNESKQEATFCVSPFASQRQQMREKNEDHG